MRINEIREYLEGLENEYGNLIVLDSNKDVAEIELNYQTGSGVPHSPSFSAKFTLLEEEVKKLREENEELQERVYELECYEEEINDIREAAEKWDNINTECTLATAQNVCNSLRDAISEIEDWVSEYIEQ